MTMKDRLGASLDQGAYILAPWSSGLDHAWMISCARVARAICQKCVYQNLRALCEYFSEFGRLLQIKI
jgi:hypothetical protein